MAISRNLEIQINRRLFTAYEHGINHNQDFLRNEEVFSTFFKINLPYNEPIYYPICFNNYIIHTLKSNSYLNDNDKYNEIVVNTFSMNILNEYTIDKFMLKVLTRDIDDGLFKAKIKDKLYYGFRGFIMDSNFNVLFALCHNAIIQNDKCYIQGIDACITKETLINNSNGDPVCKFILNKLVPHLVTNQYRIITNYNSNCIETYNSLYTPNFVVKDLNTFIKKVAEPNIEVFEEGVLNNTILQNQDDLFRIN